MARENVGHICADYNGPICHCGNLSYLKIMAARLANATSGREKALSGESMLLADRLAENDGILTAVNVGRAVAAGD
jgi:hypothetical protein